MIDGMTADEEKVFRVLSDESMGDISNGEGIKKLLGDFTNEGLWTLATDCSVYLAQQEGKHKKAPLGALALFLEGVRIGRGLQQAEQLDKELGGLDGA